MNIATQIQIELSGSDIADILIAHVLKELHARNLVTDTSTEGNPMTVTHNGNGSVSMSIATGNPPKPNMIADAASKFVDASAPSAPPKPTAKEKAATIAEKASKANAEAKADKLAKQQAKENGQDDERIRKERNDAVVANADKNFRESGEKNGFKESVSKPTCEPDAEAEKARSKQRAKANALIEASAKPKAPAVTNNPFQVVPDAKAEPSKIIKEAAERKLAESADPDAAVGIDALKEQLDAPKNNFAGKTNNPFQVA